MSEIAAVKRLVHAGLDRLARAGPDELAGALAAVYHPEASWRGSQPLNELEGLAAIEAEVWGPLARALPDKERRDLLLIGGSYEQRDYVGAVGHLVGTFAGPWLGIAPTGAAMYLRYGELHQVRDGRIVQSTVLFDILDFLRQAGLWPLAPMRGSAQLWLGPRACGIDFDQQDPAESRQSIEMVLAMHRTLHEFDDAGLSRDSLLRMPQASYWHPQMMWYGPAGIGTARGLAGFVDVHQLPFRRAFPNRQGVGHYARFGDGRFAATGGWPSVAASHAGDGFMGLAATGRSVTMRVMDFYLRDEGLLRENWVPLDMIDLLLQLDCDVFGLLRERGAGLV